MKKVQTLTLIERLKQLSKKHGSLRAVSRATRLDPGYLSNLRSGKKVNPGPRALRKLGLRRVISYVPIVKGTR